uniref:Uncharacterized protein n=1 Tax=viral metagenome TaxID=1070528 RepID=A0A6C0B8C4_9ZZZZ
METQPKKIFTTCEDSSTVEYKNTIIIMLLGLFILSLLGINVLGMGSRIIDSIIDIFAPIFRNVLDMFGYSFGSAIKYTASEAENVAKVGIEVVGDSGKDAGEIIMQQTKKENFDTFLNTSPYIETNVETLVSSNPIQK